MTSSTSAKPHIVFVCTGNICRSAMADVIVSRALDDAGLGDSATVSSCGLGSWHVRQQADPRARSELHSAGYDGSHHRAQQLGGDLLSADLFIAADDSHVHALREQGIDDASIRLLRSFDPEAPAGAVVEDPYYGGPDGFRVTREQIEAATDGIVDWVRSAVR